jgi:hypothetical protein
MLRPMPFEALEAGGGHAALLEQEMFDHVGLEPGDGRRVQPTGSAPGGSFAVVDQIDEDPVLAIDVRESGIEGGFPRK